MLVSLLRLFNTGTQRYSRQKVLWVLEHVLSIVDRSALSFL